MNVGNKIGRQIPYSTSLNNMYCSVYSMMRDE